MKTIHALVGYLAATSALPFSIFAFASPVAANIDYDGYVNTTLPTQSHRDDGGALIKRVPGDIIEPRQALVVVPLALFILSIVANVVLSIVWIAEDDPKRESFTYDTVSRTIAQYPSWNWVICHSPYSIGFDGVEGTDWGYTHHELGISLGRTIGYDLYWAKSGTFYRYGDGGFINWAYNGNILGTDDGGATVHFGVIS